MKRFWDKTKSNGRCLIWIAAKYPNGYGAFRLNGKLYGAHVVAYKLSKGDIPVGMEVCHTCDTRDCVNPEHLWIGTRKDNMVDASRKGRIVIRNRKYATLQEKRKVDWDKYYARHRVQILERKRQRWHSNQGVAQKKSASFGN